jgi:hypothetical protein
MLVRQKLTIGVSSFVMTLMLSGCSPDQPRDINYGTDVGVGFFPPDAGAFKDVPVEESGHSADVEGSEVSQLSVDESQETVTTDLDASIDGSN